MGERDKKKWEWEDRGKMECSFLLGREGKGTVRSSSRGEDSLSLVRAYRAIVPAPRRT